MFAMLRGWIMAREWNNYYLIGIKRFLATGIAFFVLFFIFFVIFFFVLFFFLNFTPDSQRQESLGYRWMYPLSPTEWLTDHAEPRVSMLLGIVNIGRGKWESLHFVERRLLSASSLQSKLRTLGIHVADDAMVDVLGMCLYASPLKVI